MKSKWRPRASVRAEDGQWWQDLQGGHASSNVGEQPDSNYFAAVLYLPDPDSKTGWQIHGVDQPEQPEAERPLGFQTRREG